MQKVKRRIFSGVVCEQEVFCISDRIKDIFPTVAVQERGGEGKTPRGHLPPQTRKTDQRKFFSGISILYAYARRRARGTYLHGSEKDSGPLHPQIEIRLPRRRDLCISRSWEKHTPHSYAYAGRRSAAGSHPTKMGTGQHPADRPPAGA